MKPFQFLLSLLLLVTLCVNAQMPVMHIKTANADQQSVVLQKLNIEVQIMGNIATTTMTMTFFNNSTKILEGELTFPMPEGVTISKYSLDINGKMRAAVPVEKAKATEVFESVERRRIDPGLLEKVEGNNFRTRIYPMPVKGTRTITVGYEEELKFDKGTALRYHLPLDYNQKIAEFSLKTTVFESVIRPDLVEQPDGSFSFKNTGNTYMATLKKTDYQPKKSLTINLPKRTDLPEVQMQKASNGYYFLINVFPKEQSRPRTWSNQIGLIWDCSLSGLQRDLVKELALLDLIIKQKQNLTINLGLLNNTFKNAGSFVIVNGDWSALRKKLEGIVYDGGTNFSAINPRALIGSEYIFFTDGLSTFGKSTVFLNKPIHTINSTVKADYSTLKYISLKSGGEFVNLNSNTTETAFKLLNEEQLQYLGIKNSGEVRQTYPSMHVNVMGHLAVAGILSQYSTNVILQFGYGNTVVSEQTVRLDPNAQNLNTIDVSKVWAQKKISEMDIQYEVNKEEISQLSKQFGIVTRNTSLIVLENVDDYLRYDIIPPADLRPQYDAVLKQQRASLLASKNNLMIKAFEMSKTLKTWWTTDFKAKKKEEKFPRPVAVGDSAVSYNAVAVGAAGNANRMANQQAQEVMLRRREAESQSSKTADDKAGSVVVYGYSSPAPVSSALQGRVAGVSINNSSSRSYSTEKVVEQGVIIIPEFKSDKDYMKSLTGTPKEAYDKYLTIRPQYLSTPTFYFDVATWFYQQADSTTALKILSNIADLDLENADLYKLLAYKLKQTKNYRAAVFVAEKVLQWRPMDAQSYRDYALALVDDGSYQLALDNLYKVLTQSYNDQTASRDEGIEEIVITEMNNLIARYGTLLNTKGIDKRLLQPLAVDIRVVLNWNKNDTDIDLWLTDPNGEKCYYSNQTTSIGGRLSNDFTDGYGPEQFMLKKAIKGNYKIEVDYYGDRQLTISGPTTVTAEIYTSYSSGKEERKIIILPLSESNKNKGHLIGEFKF